MPEAMTKERLEELQEMAADAIDRDDEVYGEALSEACSEIERLQAELAEARENAKEWRDGYLASEGVFYFLPWEEGA